MRATLSEVGGLVEASDPLVGVTCLSWGDLPNKNLIATYMGFSANANTLKNLHMPVDILGVCDVPPRDLLISK